MNALLIEDSKGDRLLLQEAFKAALVRCQLNAVEDGEAASAFLKRKAPYQDAPAIDLILLDLNLPGKSGREILSEFKTDPGLRRIPILILTNSVSQTDVCSCYQLHANGYLNKPNRFEDMVQMVKSIGEFWFTHTKYCFTAG